MVLGTEMKWKEVMEKSLKIWGGRVMSWIQDASVIFLNGLVKGSQKVTCQNVVKIRVLMKLMEKRDVSDRRC